MKGQNIQIRDKLMDVCGWNAAYKIINMEQMFWQLFFF